MGKTITTYLIDGTPKGVQTVVISNRTMIAYNIPHIRIDILREDERKELRTPALYILIGEEESGNPKAYIGETENFAQSRNEVPTTNTLKTSCSKNAVVNRKAISTS